MATYTINERIFRETVKKLLVEALLAEQETIGDKALLPSRPEGMPVDDVTGMEEPVMEEDEELEEEEDEVVESLPSKSKGRDVRAERRLELIAEEAAVDLEDPIVAKLNLVDPNDMSPEDQEKYIEVMNVMQDKVTAAVLEAVSQLSSLPKNVEE
jgi:hypothetical protein